MRELRAFASRACETRGRNGKVAASSHGAATTPASRTAIPRVIRSLERAVTRIIDQPRMQSRKKERERVNFIRSILKDTRVLTRELTRSSHSHQPRASRFLRATRWIRFRVDPARDRVRFVIAPASGLFAGICRRFCRRERPTCRISEIKSTCRGDIPIPAGYRGIVTRQKKPAATEHEPSASNLTVSFGVFALV